MFKLSEDASTQSKDTSTQSKDASSKAASTQSKSDWSIFCQQEEAWESSPNLPIETQFDWGDSSLHRPASRSESSIWEHHFVNFAFLTAHIPAFKDNIDHADLNSSISDITTIDHVEDFYVNDSHACFYVKVGDVFITTLGIISIIKSPKTLIQITGSGKSFVIYNNSVRCFYKERSSRKHHIWLPKKIMTAQLFLILEWNRMYGWRYSPFFPFFFPF